MGTRGSALRYSSAFATTSLADEKADGHAVANAEEKLEWIPMRPSPTARVALFVSAFLLASTECVVAQSRAYRGDLPESMREILGIRLNRDGPAATQRQLGKTRVRTTGDAGDAAVRWCYRSIDADSTVILFSADLEMSGRAQAVDVIRVSRTGHVTESTISNCAQLKSVVRIQTRGGLRLGSTRSEVRKLLGRPNVEDANSVEYVWETTQLLPRTAPNFDFWNKRRKECFEGRAPFFDVDGSVTVRFDGSGAYELIVSRGDSVIC